MSQRIDLNTYLGKELECECGKKHITSLKRVDIASGATKNLPRHIKELGYEKVFVVADVNTWEAAGNKAAKVLKEAGIIFEKFVFADKELIPDEKAVGSIMTAFPEESDLILAVGSGTLNDLCKFVSFQLGIDYIVFASAPSMDGFVSDGAALITNHVKTTYKAHVPVAVIGDTKILAQAPMEMITAGLGDILGKYTCLLDWKMAKLLTDEYYCAEVADMVKNAVEVVLEQSKKIRQRDEDAVKAVTEALILTGIGMSFVGNSRPASGCEHHLSHYWEMQFQMEGKKPILHGIKVAIGMITAIKMYQMLIEEDLDFEAIKAGGFNYEVWKNRVEKCYREAADGILALEEKCQKNNLDNRNERLEKVEANWSEIKELIKKELPRLEDMEELLLSLGAAVNPEQIGISYNMIEDGIILAKEVRNRFTLLQILWDLGLLEKYAKIMKDYFKDGQKAYIQYVERENKKRIDQVKLFVLDMDGTIYLENKLFPFTKTFLDKLKDTGRDFCYFTNNSSKNQRDYMEKLEKMGIPVREDRMFLSTQVIIKYLEENHPEASFYVVGTPNLEQAFMQAGLLLDDENPDIVVLGFDTTLTYEKISKACQFIRDGAGYYGVNADYNCPMKDGKYIPDCGSIAKLVERSTERFPQFFGKPSHYALEYVMEQTGYKDNEIAVVGDRIYTDIALVGESDATSIMVLTGETQMEDLEQYDIIPDMIVNSLEDLIELL